MQIIDFECDTPTKEAVEDTVRLIQSGRGFDKEGYAQQMAPGWAAQIGMSLEEFNEAKATEGLTSLALKLCDVDMTRAMSHADVIEMLDKAGVAKLEHGVRELGVKGFEVSSYREGRYINDPAYWPFFEKCVELDIPTRITAGLHLLSDRPYDYAHPKYLDEVAVRFPTLRIIAGLSGWPWVAETCAIASRHQNLYIDFACRRVKHMLAPGAGYEALIYYGARNLQDKIIFGSGWGTHMIPLAQLVAETDELPLKDSVRAKWMGGNAARVLKLG